MKHKPINLLYWALIMAIVVTLLPTPYLDNQAALADGGTDSPSATSAITGAMWRVEFGGTWASCTDDTESAYTPDALEPQTVFIALDDNEMIFGNLRLTAFGANQYEVFYTHDAGSETMVVRVYIETTATNAYRGEITLNFNGNTCSATMPMILIRIAS